MTAAPRFSVSQWLRAVNRSQYETELTQYGCATYTNCIELTEANLREAGVEGYDLKFLVARVEELRALSEEDAARELSSPSCSLFIACRDGDKELVESLLQTTGASMNWINIFTRVKQTTLHVAAVNVDGHHEIMKLLIKSGANLNALDVDQDTPAHYAALEGEVEALKLLHQGGASLNVANKDGKTPLDFAVTFNESAAVDYLKQTGALAGSEVTSSRPEASPSVDTQGHIIATIRMMKEKGSLYLRLLHLILHGLPAAGKTCAKLRLTGQELTGRKCAELRDGKLVYPPDDGACSTPVAEGITRARVPSSTAVFARGADDLPWHLLQNLDEETRAMVLKIANLSERMIQQSIATTSQSAISQPEHTGTVFQKLVTRAFKSSSSDTLQDLVKETLIYLIDSGGQPQFQELLPTLVSGPSVFLLTFSLATPLNSVHQVVFNDRDGKREVYPTNMRVKDVIVQSLASIRCTCSYQTNGEERVEVKPRVIFMATMRSLVKATEIEAIDKELKILIEPFQELVITNGTGTVFPVDSFTSDGIADLRAAVLGAAEEMVTKTIAGVPDTSPMCQVRLPTTAVALELLLRYEERGIIPLDKCKRLAKDCNIDPDTELPHVLWVLHHFTGSIRYYPGNSILQQYVVTRPQKLYDIPSTLLTHTFAFKKVDLHRLSKDKLWTRGVFTEETLRKLWAEDEDLTPGLIIAFLLHLNIIAEIDDTESGGKHFFMPSALVCSPNDDYMIVLEVRKDSILVCFLGGYSPRGVFSSVLAFLLKKKQDTLKESLKKKQDTRKEPLNLEWSLPTDKSCLCCNRASLFVTINDEFDLSVTLSVHLKFIEISVDSVFKDDPVTLDEMQHGCNAVFPCVSSAVQAVIQSLHYNSYASVCNGLYFPCHCANESSLHAVEYLPKRRMGKCHGRPTRPPKVWIDKWIKATPGAEKSLPSTSPHQTAPLDQSDALYQSPEMHELMNRVAQSRPVKWFQVGIQLKINVPTLQAFEAVYSDQMRLFAEVFEKWRQQKTLPYTWNTIIIALEAVDEKQIAADIRQWLEKKID